jgi:hypothetical protein
VASGRGEASLVRAENSPHCFLGCFVHTTERHGLQIKLCASTGKNFLKGDLRSSSALGLETGAISGNLTVKHRARCGHWRDQSERTTLIDSCIMSYSAAVFWITFTIALNPEIQFFNSTFACSKSVSGLFSS